MEVSVPGDIEDKQVSDTVVDWVHGENVCNKCPVIPVREDDGGYLTVLVDQTRDKELDDGNVNQQDLNEGYQEVESSLSGSDLGLSVEREIHPGLQAHHSTEGNGETLSGK